MLSDSFAPHLRELRRRFLFVLAAVVLAAFASYLLIEDLLGWLSLPLARIDPSLTRLVYTGLPEAMFTYIKLALLSGFILALPVMVYHLWMFLAPGLHKNEKETAVKISVVGFLLFSGGAAFAYFVVLPDMLRFLLWFAGDKLEPHLRLAGYVNFVIRSCFAFGLSFELPFLMYMAVRLELVDTDYFSRYRTYSYIGIFIVAIFLVAGDPVAAVMLCVPLFLLYEGGNVLGRIFHRGKRKQKTD